MATSQHLVKAPIGRKSVLALLFTVGTLSSLPAEAIPYFARKHNLQCTACHTVPPALNAKGENFAARGYRVPGSTTAPSWAAPVSAWITGRYERRSSDNADDVFLNKVELVSGGPIGETNLSYFAEWRIVSLDLQGDQSQRDRGGRFEDLWLNWSVGRRTSLTFGQYRALNQVDVSRRLSPGTPAVFGTSLPGEPSANARQQSLRAFSPAGRSPGVTVSHQSVAGAEPREGLFHIVTLPFPGEFSIPLNEEAETNASFELEGSPKGVYLETYYRRKNRSIGAHAFVDDDRKLVQALGTLAWKRFEFVGVLGADNRDGARSRGRYSAQAEYLARLSGSAQAAAGMRVEHISNTGRETSYIPYVAASLPNRQHTFLVSVEYRAQEGNNRLVFELGTVF